MAIAGDKLTPVTPELKTVIFALVEDYGSRLQVAQAAGISRTPLNDLYSGELTYMHSSILRKLLKLQKDVKTSDFQWYTRNQIKRKFGINIGGNAPINMRMINGVAHRECFAPQHKGQRWLPLERFSTTYGTPRSWCRVCDTLQKGTEPWWPLDNLIMSAAMGVIYRLGRAEAARRIGISYRTLYNIERRNVMQIRRRTARKILAAWIEIQKTGEVRHKDSISHGASQRGRQEKTPKDRRDFYHSSGDNELQYKRKFNRKRRTAIPAKKDAMEKSA